MPACPVSLAKSPPPLGADPPAQFFAASETFCNFPEFLRYEPPNQRYPGRTVRNENGTRRHNCGFQRNINGKTLNISGMLRINPGTLNRNFREVERYKGTSRT
jgi:hypothetical protein